MGDRPAELFQTCMVLVHMQGRALVLVLTLSALMFLHVWLRRRGWHVVINCGLGVFLMVGGLYFWSYLLGGVLTFAKTWPSQLLLCVLLNGLLLCFWWQDIGLMCRCTAMAAASRRASFRSRV